MSTVCGSCGAPIRWVGPPRSETERYSSRPKGKDGKAIPTAGGRPRRWRSSGPRSRRKIEPYPQPECAVASNIAAVSARLLLALAAVFGTKHQRASSQWAGYRNISSQYPGYHDHGGQNLGGKPQKAWELLEVMRRDAEKCLTELWHEVRLVLLERLAYLGTPTNVAKLWTDAERVCEVLNIDSAKALRQAVEALPEPKSWAGLQANGQEGR